MKILIHSTTLDGEPLEADGIALEGKNCEELVEIMKGQTPFTIEASTRDYMLGVLSRIEPDRKIKLPEDPEAAAAEFLTLLGKHGLVGNGEVRDYADLARLGYVTRARITQIMNLLNLAPDIQEALLYLPRTVKGRNPIREKDVRPITAVAHWHRQRKMWAKLVKNRMSS